MWSLFEFHASKLTGTVNNDDTHEFTRLLVLSLARGSKITWQQQGQLQIFFNLHTLSEYDGLLTFFNVWIRGCTTVMFLAWAVFGVLLLPVLTAATHPPVLERKMSTMLSFDLRRKTKHHHEKNTTVRPPTPAPTPNGEEEEMEFSLRVCGAKRATKQV